MPVAEKRTNEIDIDAITTDHISATIQALAKQPKRPVYVRKPMVSKPEAAIFEYIGINGFWVTVPYDKSIQVPDEIYRILLRADMTLPIDEKDEHELPPRPKMPNGAPLPQNFDIR